MPIAPDPAASPLARALAAQAEAQVTDLARARGLAGDTFAKLADRATHLIDALSDTLNDPDDAGLDALRDRRAALRAVARLIDDPKASEIPPSNDAIYAAVLDVTELGSIVSALTSERAVSARRVLAHLTTADARAARHDRLTLAFAAVCKRAGLAVSVPDNPEHPLSLDIGRWSVAAAPAVPLRKDDLAHAAAEAESALRVAGRPGLIVLEAGALLDPSPLRVADDKTALAAMNQKLDAFMIDSRDQALDAIEPGSGTGSGIPHAFGLVVHATLPATNVASRRLLFAECLRAVNLCDADDSRINGFQQFVTALGKVKPPAM